MTQILCVISVCQVLLGMNKEYIPISATQLLQFFFLPFSVTWLSQFFFPLIFGNLGATILFSLSSLPNFGNLVATIGFFPFENSFGHLIWEQILGKNFGNLVIDILQFFSHSSNHIISLSRLLSFLLEFWHQRC